METAVASTVSVPSTRLPNFGTGSFGLSVILGLISSVLLDFCFPVAGPLPPWRAALAWIALVPLLYALLSEGMAGHPRYIRRAALVGWLCGLLWYILNCYWIYQTMHLYAHVAPVGAAGIVFLFSAVLGLYFGAFGLLLAFLRKRMGAGWALVAAPFLWAALELAAARITSVPWDQLGYSQVDNLWLTRLAPVTGVYGISFVLMAVNALLTGALMVRPNWMKLRLGATGLAIAAVLQMGSFIREMPSPTSAFAVLLQPNNRVANNGGWQGKEWDGSVAWLLQQSVRTCTPAFMGMPRPHVPTPQQNCRLNTAPPGVVVWPETESWFVSNQPQTIAAVQAVALAAHAPFVTGMLGVNGRDTYNSALFTRANGTIEGRYDKIHLVPFGEYIPYRRLFFFAHKLTHELVDLQRGTKRVVFHANGHTFGVFICYESVFANEVRHFAENGAQVLVNISDDGWYGNTSAPWQHLNMTRMRAIENHRWVLLDTNSGVTTAIDPHGRVTYSAPRHRLTALTVRYGYEKGTTFYTRHGDVFAYFCSGVLILFLLLGLMQRRTLA